MICLSDMKLNINLYLVSKLFLNHDFYLYHEHLEFFKLSHPNKTCYEN